MKTTKYNNIKNNKKNVHQTNKKSFWGKLFRTRNNTTNFWGKMFVVEIFKEVLRKEQIDRTCKVVFV